ncbi:MAG: hypothetical protein ACKVWV_03560 [Planctomycetota bacterium]
MKATKTLMTMAFGLGIVGAAHAQTDVPAGLITTSETWTLAGSPYRLKGQVYVTNNATLTIEPGVIVASLPADQGSLAICTDAQIIANGTHESPIIFTSTNDVATWSGTTGSGAGQIPGNPRTGTWREAAQEWGNLTLMGLGYISEDATVGNTAIPSASNTAIMEGLTNGASTDSYGGGNDDHDSGSISYVSLRFGGKVVASTVELNGLSLGGIGRDTDIHHIDIMNNIDDGVEVWGGTVNLKYMNIWNIGDDSLDIDQGWRGKAQFGLIVQGRSIQAAQGGGTGDNAIEVDGAEDSFWQPVTTTSIYNYTVVGMPNTVDPVANSSGGDHGTAWRDNARVQYRNSIFMDIGERVVSFDNTDGDGGDGYGALGTLSWADTWTTAYNAVPAHGNDFTSGTYASNYPAQSSGRLAEMTDNVFFRNQHTSAYTEANLRDVFNVANNNVIAVSSPITALTRAASATYLGLNVANVATIDPRPTNDALTPINMAPINDNFFQAARYRGGFSPNAQSWICNWTASSAFGFVTNCGPGFAFCFGDGKLVTDCPCVAPNTVPNPPAMPEHGCANSLNLDGAVLSASGVASPIGSDTVTLRCSVAPFHAAFAFLVKGNAVTPNGLAASDGIRCASGALVRFGGHNTGSNGNPAGVWIYPNTAQTASVSTATAQVAGQKAYYQLFYRNAFANFCTTATANFSNAYQIQW